MTNDCENKRKMIQKKKIHDGLWMKIILWKILLNKNDGKTNQVKGA